MKAIRHSRFAALGAAALIWKGVVSFAAGEMPRMSQTSGNPAKGVRCAASFESLYDAGTKVLRCRRVTTSWVVTACEERSFASYIVRSGRDVCGPTQLPGIGAPPGIPTHRSIACAAPGYDIVVDRTGQRDRCERESEQWQLPVPVP
jgi:hypothetical protein